MGVTSATQIQNSALIKLGAEIIVSDTDVNPRALLVKNQYPIVRDMLIRSHLWNFATAYSSLAVVDPKPADVFDYDYVYQLPSDCLRTIKTNLPYTAEWEEIEGRRIACNTDSLKIQFLRKITDVTKYDDNFVEALAYALAEDVCYAFTQSTSHVESISKRALAALRLARSFDAQVGSVRRVISDDILDSRRY